MAFPTLAAYGVTIFAGSTCASLVCADTARSSSYFVLHRLNRGDSSIWANVFRPCSYGGDASRSVGAK